MKKSYLMIAAAAAMFAACSDSEIKNNIKEYDESPIAFSTYAGKQTRADNSNQTDHSWLLEDHHNSFDVWAWKYYNSAWVSTAVYDKGTVNYSSSAWATTGDNIRYWDKSAEKYYFYAAAPSSDNWVLNNKYTASTNENGDNAYLSYANFILVGSNLSTSSETNYVESFKNLTDVDLMIAENNEVARAKYNKTPADEVVELFDHILSRLNITVKRGTALTQKNATLKLTSFKIFGVNLCNKGSFDESLANSSSNPLLSAGTTARWYQENDQHAQTSPSRVVINDNNDPYDLVGAVPTANIEGTALYIGQYLIIPQSITSEVLDRASAHKNLYYTQEEIDAATEGQDAYGKTTADIKTPGGGAAAAHPYFKIEYTIDNEPYTAYYNLANAFGTAAEGTLAFNEGWQNTLNIIIDADVINFDAQVYQWANGNTTGHVDIK